jgi:hypothetical protein
VKASFLIKSLLGLGIAALLFYAVGKNSPEVSSQSSENSPRLSQSQNGKQSSSTQSVARGFRDSRSFFAPSAAESPRCRQVLTKIGKRKFSLPQHGIQPDGLIQIAAGQPSTLRDMMQDLTQGGCEPFSEDHPLKAVQDRVKAACGISGAPMGDSSYAMRLSTQCYVALEEYRAETSDYLTRGIPLNQIADVDLLSTRAETYIARTQGFDPGYYAALNERILELDPNNATAGKNALRGRYLDWLDTQSAPDTDKDEHLDKTLSVWETNHPGDTIVQEIKMDRARMKGDLDTMRKIAMETEESGVTPDEGTYYLAWAAYLGNDKASAKQYLSAIVGKDPSNQRAVHALAELSAPTPSDDAHIFSDLITSMPDK